MDKTSVTLQLGGKTLTFETGQLAKLATSSILARLGDTMVLVTVVEGQNREDLGYFPLSVEYVERLYAGGKIKGSRWVKREGRPSDDAILTARLIDRSIRPLFPKEYKKEVQVVVTLLSVDGENEPDVLAVNAVSAALAISHIPWNGPIGAVRVGFVTDNGNKEFIVNPGSAEIELSEIDLLASQTKGKTVMIEASGKQVPEDVAISAVKKAHEETSRIIAFIEDFAKKVGQKKATVEQDAMLREVVAIIEKTFLEEVRGLIAVRAAKEATGTETQDLVEKIFEHIHMQEPESPVDKKTVGKAVEYVFYKSIRENILKKKKRPDGRKIDEVRPISAMVSVLPRTHGSAIFQRGDTQVLTVATLGSPRLEQLIESAGGEESKRYIHHYSFPPYSVGETGRMGTPNRREIGHGALAEKAIIPVIPSQEKFPYTIRVVSEVLSSNGSTSMASTCGSTLALMDAGVPIEKPVAGIAMGMMSDQNSHVILTDIIGLEDFSGDMDFKVAGTDSGMSAIQLDVKIPGLSVEQVEETLKKAKLARLHILEKMLAVLPDTRKQVSEYAPKIVLIHVPVDKIGEIIGPGGRVIKTIIAQTGATVDVEDDGTVAISGTSDEAVQKASEWVQGLIRELTVGETFEGEVKRILPFGAFVEVLPGKEGMVHVSKMSSQGFVKSPNDVVKIGDKVKVRVVEIDDQGRVNLSMIFDDKQGSGPQPGSGFQPGSGSGLQPGSGPQPRASMHAGPRMQRPQQPVGLSQAPTPDAKNPSSHPLSMQFRRERAQWQRKTQGGQRRTQRAGSARPRFRKAHY